MSEGEKLTAGVSPDRVQLAHPDIDVAVLAQQKAFTASPEEMRQLQLSANALFESEKLAPALIAEISKYPDDERGRQLIEILSTKIFSSVDAVHKTRKPTS